MEIIVPLNVRLFGMILLAAINLKDYSVDFFGYFNVI
jgi:hypothetical protein